jgi:uncharacterized protein
MTKKQPFVRASSWSSTTTVAANTSISRIRCPTRSPGDYNCLHQDVYGQISFPFQLTFFLSAPREDYDGGEFVLVEQRPRAQSRPEVIQPQLGDMVVIPNRYRAVQGKQGFHRTVVRHGVSRVRRGERYTLGIIFHDAQ